MGKKYTNEWWQTLAPEKVGKETEGLVKSALEGFNKKLNFTYHRLPDAKAARGALQAQPADFQYMFDGTFGFIEVKALKHPHRLPTDRVSQLPVLKKWALAGASSCILVFHYMTGTWRVLRPQRLAGNVPSWDMTEEPCFSSCEEALSMFFNMEYQG